MKAALIYCALATVIGLGSASETQAGNRVDPTLIQYRNWDGAKPNVVTMISGQVSHSKWIHWGNPYNVKWANLKNELVAVAQREQLCDLVNRASGGMCQGTESPRIEIREIFLGEAAQFQPSGVSDHNHIGRESLAGVPPGAKRVLHLALGQMGNLPMEVIAIAFDDVTDDVLRQIAYEDGVLRALYYRED